ncbi:MAG: DUF2254 domain-containing protein [Chloroflexota bacterium]|nr:DUF2254 domain-containing protein [Chloroflexota bacterium]
MARLGARWLALRDSLWFLPALITVAAAGLAWITVEMDSRMSAAARAGVTLAFGGGVEGARGVLDAISGTMITVTSVVFSLTFVALQLASSQFTPRVLRNFTGDRANQAVLGVFIGTFTYSLLVLRTIRSAVDDGTSFVPSISVGVAIGLALVSIGFLIFYIHHTARTIQASVIIDRTTAETNTLVRRLFPQTIGEPDAEPLAAPVPVESPAVVTAEHAGYLQAVDSDTLFDRAVEGRLTVRMEPAVGDFVLPGAALASVWPAGAAGDEVVDGIRSAFVLGLERTLQQDVEFGIRQLADIAIKALSPGINDPTTATICIDRLAEVLVNLGTRHAPERARRDDEGRVRFLARETTFVGAVDLAFDQIRHYGVGDAHVVAHLLETLGRIAELVPSALRPALIGQASSLLESARESVRVPRDLARVEWAAAWTAPGGLMMAGPPQQTGGGPR